MAVFVWQPSPRWFWSIPAVEGADGRSNLPSVYAEHVHGLILIFGTCANTDPQFDTGANPHGSEQDCKGVQNSQLLSCCTCESQTWQLATDDVNNKMLTTFVWAPPDFHIPLGRGIGRPIGQLRLLVFCVLNWLRNIGRWWEGIDWILSSAESSNIHIFGFGGTHMVQWENQ